MYVTVANSPGGVAYARDPVYPDAVRLTYLASVSVSSVDCDV